jgi:molybdopterin synthase sulfur carrier subunit
MPVVWVPSLLRDLTGGQEQVRVPGASVSEAIEELERRHPGIKARLCDDEGLQSGIAVIVGTEVSQLGLRHPLGPDSEVFFVPAIGGGHRPQA